MTREQERAILRQNMNHYLWNKPRAQWTEQDLKNLEAKKISEGPTGDVIYSKQPQRKAYKQPIVVVKDGEDTLYESVALCAAELELEPNYIYPRLNGKVKNKGQYQFFKSKINN